MVGQIFQVSDALISNKRIAAHVRSFEERQNGRRLVKVKHSLEMNAEQPEIIVRLEPILRPNIQAFDTVISCIFWEERSYWVFTSVDAILVLGNTLSFPFQLSL